MYFFVIEGDNGTGKDSLAQRFQLEGYEIITYDKRIKEMEKTAKSMKGKEKVLNFIAYNKKCGNLAKEKRKNHNVMLVRYFISSLAAGYADNIFSYEETMKLLETVYDEFEKPDTIIRLKCNSIERLKRIKQRNSDDFDDKTIERENKYRWITDKMKEKIDINWIEINTSNISKEEVYDYTRNLLESIYKNNIEYNRI